MEEPSLSSYVGEIVSGKSYQLWFSSRLSQKYVGALPLRYNLAVCDEQKQNIAAETSSVLTIYSLLVYYIYPGSKKMQEEIERSAELSENFRLVKEWLDANGGKQIADEFLENMASRGAG